MEEKKKKKKKRKKRERREGRKRPEKKRNEQKRFHGCPATSPLNRFGGAGRIFQVLLLCAV